jgi:molecular chaperone IbpA
MTRLTTLDLPSFNRATIGFDRIFNELERQFANSASTGYPPYNIAQVTDDEYVISLAVAGFGMEQLDITHEHDVLSVEGTAPKCDEDTNYLHKGIAGRNFRRQFTLADHVKVVRAELDLGMLNIYLQREVPEELQPKKIEIQSGKSVTIEG